MFEWHKRFSKGGEDVEDEKQLDHPVTLQTDKNVKKAIDLERTDCCLGKRMTAEELIWMKKLNKF